MIYLQLFLSFIKVGMFSIGGGYAAMPLIQSEVVNGHGWLTMNEFTDLITIAEMTPGSLGINCATIAVNSATFVGIRIGGIPGALVATGGCILPSCVIVSALALLYNKYKNVSTLQSVLSSLRPAVVALIAAAGLSLLLNVAGDKVLLLLFAGAFFVLRKWKWNPILVMLLCGVLNLGIHLISPQ